MRFHYKFAQNFGDFINVDKESFEMMPFHFVDIMRLKRNLLPLARSHGNGFW